MNEEERLQKLLLKQKDLKYQTQLIDYEIKYWYQCNCVDKEGGKLCENYYQIKEPKTT